MDAAESPRTKRINMRLTEEAFSTIKQAVEIQQQDMTSFVLGAALERARAVLAEDLILRLTPHEIRQLEDAIDGEPQVIPQLEAMIRRFGVGAKDQQRA
jgi:uncharacterized protein (DUF1778 family)